MLMAFFASEGTSWWSRVEPYLNYPGFEAWKFFNLAVFVAVMVYILTRKADLGAAFRARQESIKKELEQAQQERDAALLKLKEVEERFARLDAEIAAIDEQTKRDIAEERERIAQSTETEINKLSEQAQREIERAGKAAKKDLRRYTAEQSVRLAEELIRREMKPEDDAHLIARNIDELGGAAQ